MRTEGPETAYFVSRICGRGALLTSVVVKIDFKERLTPQTANTVLIDPQPRLVRFPAMNNSSVELSPPHTSRAGASDELTQLKKDLMQAEIRLAKARATVTGAEVDIKVLDARLKALAK